MDFKGFLNSADICFACVKMLFSIHKKILNESKTLNLRNYADGITESRVVFRLSNRTDAYFRSDGKCDK